jgi:hypothetical protein
MKLIKYKKTLNIMALFLGLLVLLLNVGTKIKKKGPQLREENTIGI